MAISWPPISHRLSLDDSYTPSDIPNLTSNIAYIASGGGGGYSTGTTCVITTSGTIKCWGGNQFGQLGNGNTINSTVPVDLPATNY